MASFETIPLSGIPNDVLDSVLHDVANFTIGFAQLGLGKDGRDVELIGSGTLIKVGSVRAILTAHHVTEVVPSVGRVGIILASARQTPTIDTSALHVAFSDRGSSDFHGPDIAVVTLSEPVASTIAAKKTFYNLKLRRTVMMDNPRSISDGFWVVEGFVGESGPLLRSHQMDRSRRKAFFALVVLEVPKPNFVLATMTMSTFLSHRTTTLLPQ